MQVNEMFYDQELPPPFMEQTSAQQMIRDPKLLTMNVVTQPDDKKQPSKPDQKGQTVAMRVSICCSSCVDTIEYDIRKVKGVKSVDCDVYKHKVTVTGISVADALTAARRHFKNAELWD